MPFHRRLRRIFLIVWGISLLQALPAAAGLVHDLTVRLEPEKNRLVGPKGTFLLGGAGWYPRFPGREARFSISVEAPKGVSAVTAGRSAGHRDEAFWSGLREVYAEKRFERASWEDFKKAFARRAPAELSWDPDRFFREWVHRKGAPLLALESVSRRRAEAGWQLSGRVVQRQDRPYHLPAVLQVETVKGTRSLTLDLHGEETPFALNLPARPTRAELDPEVDVFRRLHPEEIPASINSIKGAESVSLVLSEGTGQAGRTTARMLVRSLGLSRVRIVPESELEAGRADVPCTVFIGFPADPARLPEHREPVRLARDGFSIGETSFDRPTDSFFGVFQRRGDGGGTVGLLYPVHPEYGPLVARKLTHYGRYGYLAFRKGQNLAKGVWPVTESPLIVDWPE